MITKIFYRVISFCLVILFTFVLPYTASADSTLSDNFDDNRLDPSKWFSFEAGGPTITEVNERLEIHIPEDSTNPPDMTGFIGEYVSACVLTGDYDVQVNYQLQLQDDGYLKWPARNGVRMGIATYSPSTKKFPDQLAEIQRTSWGPNDPTTPEVYLSNPNRVVIGTNDTSGKLRLARTEGETISYYFDLTEGWKNLSSSTQTRDVYLYLYAFSTDGGPFGDLFGDQEVRVAFDKLIVEGKRTCKGRFTPANPPLF